MSEAKHDERTPVPVIKRAEVPAAWAPSLRLLDQLAEVFPDSVIDIPEVVTEEDEDA